MKISHKKLIDLEKDPGKHESFIEEVFSITGILLKKEELDDILMLNTGKDMKEIYSLKPADYNISSLDENFNIITVKKEYYHNIFNIFYTGKSNSLTEENIFFDISWLVRLEFLNDLSCFSRILNDMILEEPSTYDYRRRIYRNENDNFSGEKEFLLETAEKISRLFPVPGNKTKGAK